MVCECRDHGRTAHFSYSVETFGTDYVFRVHLYLGYKINQRVNAYLRQVVQDLAATGELPPQTHDYSVYKDPGTSVRSSSS